MNAIVNGRIVIEGLDTGQIQNLYRAFSYPNPAYLALQKVGVTTAPIDVPDRLSALKVNKNSIELPRGAIFELKALLGKLSWLDQRSKGEPINTTWNPNYKLRDYQEEGRRLIKECGQGLLVLPCGCGKTILGISIIQDLQISTLVIVPTRALVQQWHSDIRSVLNIDANIFGTGKKKLGPPITIATKSALDCYLKRTSGKENELGRFGLVIIDESHRIPTAFFQKTLSTIPAKYRVGLTATPEREDGLSSLVRWSFGKILLRKSIGEMVKSGWLIQPTILPVVSDFSYEMPEMVNREWRDYSKLQAAVSRDNQRNQLIINIAIKHIQSDPTGSMLILSNLKSHCHTIVELLKANGIDKVATISSDLSKKDQEKLIEQLRTGELSIGVATSLADEGLDIPRLSGIILALPEGSARTTTQRIGRSARPFGGKKAFVYDLVDMDCQTLFYRWKKRKATYESMGLTISKPAAYEPLL